MKLFLKIDEFSIELEMDSESAIIGTLKDIAEIFDKRGVKAGGEIILKVLAVSLRDKPGFTMSKDVEAMLEG